MRAGADPRQKGCMKTTVIIEKRGEGYYATVMSRNSIEREGVRAGLTPYDAAAKAAKLMLTYATDGTEGGELMAPAEVLELVPEHLRSIAGEP